MMYPACASADESLLLDERGVRRFWRRVRVDENGCWLWVGTHDSYGYGYLEIQRRRRPAHRVAYRMLIGPIPEGLVLDHLCRVRDCVRPSHLEPVTVRVNALRTNSPPVENSVKTHCIRGHEFTPENVYVAPGGRRQCRACWKSRRDERKSRRSSATAPVVDDFGGPVSAPPTALRFASFPGRTTTYFRRLLVRASAGGEGRRRNTSVTAEGS